MNKTLVLAGLAALILGLAAFSLSNFRQEYAQGCRQLFAEKILFFEKSVWDCADKSNFVLIKPINNFNQITDQETAILFAQNHFPQVKGCRPEVNEDECCYTAKFTCGDTSISLYFSKQLTGFKSPVIYSGSDFTPTLKQSPFKDCSPSQSGDIIYADCGSYKIGFEIINYRFNRTFVEVRDPTSAISSIFKIRKELFSFLGYDTSIAAEGECSQQVESCGNDCTIYKCKVGDEWFVLETRGNQGVLKTRWGSLG